VGVVYGTADEEEEPDDTRAPPEPEPEPAPKVKRTAADEFGAEGGRPGDDKGDEQRWDRFTRGGAQVQLDSDSEDEKVGGVAIRGAGARVCCFNYGVVRCDGKQVDFQVEKSKLKLEPPPSEAKGQEGAQPTQQGSEEGAAPAERGAGAVGSLWCGAVVSHGRRSHGPVPAVI
jgi:hypothetical protein